MNRYWILAVLVCLLIPSVSGAQSLNINFTLGPGDVLQVSVWKDEALTKEVIVRPDGYFSFPLVDQVKAAGKTIEEVQKTLKSSLQEYVPDSPVTVALSELNSTKVYVVGKINEPGMYLMHGQMHVMQALATSGGFTRFADKNDIKIIRNQNGTQKAISFNYSDVANGKNLESNIVLKSGDTIVVP